MLEPYRWYDPWELAEDAEDMRLRWREREEYFYQDMRMAQNAAHDNMYNTRRQLEQLLSQVADATAPQMPPIFIKRP